MLGVARAAQFEKSVSHRVRFFLSLPELIKLRTTEPHCSNNHMTSRCGPHILGVKKIIGSFVTKFTSGSVSTYRVLNHVLSLFCRIMKKTMSQFMSMSKDFILHSFVESNCQSELQFFLSYACFKFVPHAVQTSRILIANKSQNRQKWSVAAISVLELPTIQP